MPMDRMLRMIWPWIPRRRSKGSVRRGGRRHRQSGPPGWSCRCRPCRRPGRCCPDNSPSPQHGVQAGDAAGDPRSLAGCSSPSEVIGRTEMPFSSIRKGYSLVPWAEPRYLTTRSRRVEICSVTRWSRTMTQSETYSSRPCRVSVSVAPLAGDDRRDALVLEPAEQPPQFGPQDGRVGQAGEEGFDRVQDHPLGPDRVDGADPGGRTALPGRTRRSPRSRCARCGRNPWRASSCRRVRRGRSPGRRRSWSVPRPSPRRP